MSDMAKLYTHFNRVSFGVASRILGTKDRSGQISCLMKLVDVAAEIFNAGDFLGSMAITAGLTGFDISRLNLVCSMSSTRRATLEVLEKLLIGQNNYRMLRALESCG